MAKKKNKHYKKSVENVTRAQKKADEAAANKRGIIMIAAIAVLFIAFIVLIAVSARNKGGDTVTTTLTAEEQLTQALEDFEA